MEVRQLWAGVLGCKKHPRDIDNIRRRADGSGVVDSSDIHSDMDEFSGTMGSAFPADSVCCVSSFVRLVLNGPIVAQWWCSPWRVGHCF